jgi:hypothetical protein
MASNNSPKSIWTWNIVKIIIALQVLFYFSLILFYGFNEDSWRINIRLSARLAVILFSMAFVASSLQAILKNSFTYWLRFNRKFIGISFAITHLLHLLFLIVLQYSFHPVFELAMTSSLIGGGLAYFFVIAMLFTSFARFSKYLTRRNWTLLHTIGGYWIWFIFFRSYFKKVMADHHEFWPYVLLLAIVLVLRSIQLFKKKIES